MPARDDIDDDEVWYLYNVEHWSQQKIADIYRVSQSTIYYRLHPEKQKEKTEKYKEYVKEYMKEYNQSENGKARAKRYSKTEKGKAKKKRYWLSENGKILKSRVNALRRELGFIRVNSWFEGGVWHHIDFEHVICMPAELHKSIYHNIWTDEGMEEINEVAFGYITDEEFEKLESGELDKKEVN